MRVPVTALVRTCGRVRSSIVRLMCRYLGGAGCEGAGECGGARESSDHEPSDEVPWCGRQ
mgnify:CR=1 FL=1